MGQSFSEYYIELADFELYLGGIGKWIKSDKENDMNYVAKAREIIDQGINVGATPVHLLNQYLDKLDVDLNHCNKVGAIVCQDEESDGGESHNSDRCPDVDNQVVKGEEIISSSINSQETMIPNDVEEEKRSEDNSNVCNTSSVVSSYLNRSKKRPATTSLRSKIRRKNNCSGKTLTFRTMGGPPQRLSSIDDDDVDEEEEDNDEQNVDDNLDELINNKKPKIEFLAKKNEKITPEYRNFLEQWDPSKRFNTNDKKNEEITPEYRNYLEQWDPTKKNHDSEKEKVNVQVYQQVKSFQSTMDVIEESTKENQPTLTGCNNTASTGSRGSHHATGSHNSAETSSVQNNSSRRDEATNNNGQTQSDETITQGDIYAASSPSISLSGVDIDFLPLIQEKKIVFVNNVKYLKLAVVGKGGSCKVYRCLTKDLCTVAIKKVNLKGMSRKAVEGYANEIELLRRLRGNQSIVQLYDSEVDVKRKAIFLVMEAGEVDLNHVVS